MACSQLFESKSGHTQSVPHILATDAAGEPFTHTIEPELSGATIPRVTRPTRDTLHTRRGFWNISLVFAGFVAYCARGMYNDPLWSVYGLGVFAVLAATILLATRQQNAHLRFLREGVAVHGLLRSGEVVEFGRGATEYRLHYTYWTGDKTRRGSVRVDETEYIKRVSGNPYFTVLYDAANPHRSVPYSRITVAGLAAK